jgi:23S rRNA-/tRNA-specific pseudouridylate synthase
MLHSSGLHFIHPVSGMEMRFEALAPPLFKTVVK